MEDRDASRSVYVMTTGKTPMDEWKTIPLETGGSCCLQTPKAYLSSLFAE
jgi:hypothetical protein